MGQLWPTSFRLGEYYMTGDKEDMGATVISFTHREAKQIIDKLADIDSKFDAVNLKLGKLDVVAERIKHLNDLHVDTQKRVEALETRERDKERDLQFAVAQAREFKELKPQIVQNTNFATVANRVVNWVGGITATIVAAAIISGNEPQKIISREDVKVKREASEVIHNGS